MGAGRVRERESKNKALEIVAIREIGIPKNYTYNTCLIKMFE